MSLFRGYTLLLFICSFVSISTVIHAASPSSTGQTGLINMPDAHVEEDGTWRMGLSIGDPYSAFWTSFTALPRFEFSGRYTQIDGIAGFQNNSDYGDYKDKAFDSKLLLWRESDYLPDIAVGIQDFEGTALFKGSYIVGSKHIGPFDFSAGYGQDRIDGAFGGIRYYPWWSDRLSFMAEYDAIDYIADPFAAETGIADRGNDGEINYGLDYKWGWLGAQLSKQDDSVGVNAYLSIPLMQREFIPKIQEPAPDTEVVDQLSLAEWQQHTDPAIDLIKKLQKQGFKNIKINIEGETFEANLTHSRIRLVGRAVGRAARTILLRGPKDIRAIKITYTENDLPLLTYHFTDARKLKLYFDGLLSQWQLEPAIQISYADPSYAKRFKEDPRYQIDLENDPDAKFKITSGGEDAHFITLKQEDASLNKWRIVPFNLSTFVNDPSGVFKYDIYAAANYSRRLQQGLFFNTSITYTLLENVSDVTQQSNSLLPHVRSDVAEYKKDGPLKLNRLLVNKYLHPAERVYARVSAGLYEEMFGGVGGQTIYLPSQGNWAIDLSINALRQRETGGDFEFRDYDVVTSILAWHYRIKPLGVTFTARAGRFLAKDEGVRYELKRRFVSGIEIGGWYTITNGDDITSPGTPDDPYHDKGVFLSIPLASMLTKDTRATSSVSIAPWTRDVGQMVANPGDLYRLFERRLMLDSNEHDPLTDFGQ